MWPLDSPWIWGWDDESSKQQHKALSTLPPWLQRYHLCIINHLCRIQVLISTVYLENNPSSLLRRCDSRNLNLSPFCGVDSSSTPLKLQPTLEESYGSKSVGYVQDLPSPMRKEYPLQSMASDEILSPLAKVWPSFFNWKSGYFSGWPWVQRIWERHCRCQPFLSWLNSVWSVLESQINTHINYYLQSTC